MSRSRKTALGRPGQNRKRKYYNTTGHAFERVIVNVSGDMYETYALTLVRFSHSLLGDPDKRDQYYCMKTQQYFFNRNRSCFGAILYLYQSNGILTCPPDVPLDIFESECRFFELPDENIKLMKEKEGVLTLAKDRNRYRRKMPKWQFFLWNIFENPESSYAAKFLALFSNAAILTATFTASLKTLSYFNYVAWPSIEFVLNFWFLFELLCRFTFSPTKQKFLKNKMNWVDALAVVPFLVMPLFLAEEQQKSLRFLQTLRVVRVIRLFRLSTHSKRLKIVGEIAKSSLEDLQMLFLCLAVLVIFYASMMYYVETNYNPTTDFNSIPMSLWWAVVTITTVGYGDIVPTTLFGKILSSGFMAFPLFQLNAVKW